MLRVLRRARQRLTGVSVVYLLASVVTSVRVSVTRSVYVSSRPSGRRMTMSYAPTLAGKRTVPRAGPIALGQSCGPLGTPAKYKSMWLPLELRDIPSGSRQLKVRLVVATMYRDGTAPAWSVTGPRGEAAMVESLPRQPSVADAREGRAQRLPASAARTPLRYPNPCSQPGPCAYPAACSSEASFPFSYAHARPNGSRLSCGRPARQRKGGGRSPCPARGTTLRFLESDHRPAASSACWAARPRTSPMNPFRTAPSVEHVVDASSDRSLRRTRPRSPSDARVVARSTKRTRPHP